MVEIAKRNAEEVGLSDIIKFSVKDVNTLTIDTENRGCVNWKSSIW